MGTKLHQKEVQLFGTLPNPYGDHNRAAAEKPHEVTILHRNTNLVKYRLYINHYSHWVMSEMKNYSNQTVRWSNWCSGVIRCSKTSLGTGRNNKQRPLSSQFSCCYTPNDVDYTRSCRLLYINLQGNLFSETFLDYVFERCSIVFLEYGVLGEFTFRESSLRSAWHLLASNTKLWLRKGKRTW